MYMQWTAQRPYKNEPVPTPDFWTLDLFKLDMLQKQKQKPDPTPSSLSLSFFPFFSPFLQTCLSFILPFTLPL